MPLIFDEERRSDKARNKSVRTALRNPVDILGTRTRIGPLAFIPP
jgi:hypothetical protein